MKNKVKQLDKNKGIKNKKTKEGMQVDTATFPDLPKAADQDMPPYPNAPALDKAEMEYVGDSQGLVQQKQSDPHASLLSMEKMNDFQMIDPDNSGYEYEIDSIKTPGEPNEKTPEMNIEMDQKFAVSPMTEEAAKCNAITDCKQLTGKDCGFCGSSGRFTLGDATGPKVDVCGPGQWSMTPTKCSETKERNLCASVDSCAELSGETAEKCGYCPTSGGIMPMKRVGNKNVPKYASDTCNYEGGLLKSGECAAFARDHPCITPYRNTGPHPEPCLKKLWKSSGCTGKKPYGKSFDELKSAIGSKSVTALASTFKQTYEDTLSEGDMGKVVTAYEHCYNKKPNLDPCDRKYFGTSLNEKTKLARELCSKKTWKNKGGLSTGMKAYDNLSKKEGFVNSQEDVLKMDKDNYFQQVGQLASKANKEITDEKQWPEKNEASLALYGVPADKPGSLKEGDYVKMHWSGKPTNCFLYGYVIDKDSSTQRWRVLWVIREEGGVKEERTTKMTQAVQKEKFGWNGYKAKGEDMQKVGDNGGGVIGSQLIVLKRCDSGNSMCGNSCGELIMRLMDMYPRPQDCEVTKWGAWGRCTKYCGGGKKTRTRKIQYPPMRGGLPCPALTETIGCNFTPCTNDNFKKANSVDIKGSKDKANYVQLTLPGGYLHVQEVEVYDEFGVNIASKENGGTATQSSEGWSGNANKPIDRQKNWRNWWSGPGGPANSNHTQGGSGQWWRVALKGASSGKTHTISRIIIYNRPDCCQGRLEGVEVSLWQGPPARSDWKKIDKYNVKIQRRMQIDIGNTVTLSCLHPNANQQYKSYQKAGNWECSGGEVMAISRQPGKSNAQAAEQCSKACMEREKSNNSIKGFVIYEKGGYWNGRCFCEYQDSRTCSRKGHGTWGRYDFKPYRVNKEACEAKEFGFKEKEKMDKFKKDCKNEGGTVGTSRCVDSFFEPSCHYSGKGPTGGQNKGGDLDSAMRWFGWSSRNWNVEECAKECLKNPNCNRFSFGKNAWNGAAGLGCRISDGTYNNGFSPVTTDRYKSNGWSWAGSSNHWGGQVYDRKSAVNESFVGSKDKNREGFVQVGSSCNKPGKPFEWIGDFRDTGSRDLPVRKGNVAQNGYYADALKCSQNCKDYKYFGLQYWGECWCGNTYGKHYEHTSKGKKQSAGSRHGSWSYYGGWRNKVFRNNAYTNEREGKWTKCAKYGQNCAIPDPNKYVMRFGKGDKWTEFKPSSKNEKCTFEGRWGVENPLGDAGSYYTGGNQNRPSAGRINNATECAQHLSRRGAYRGWVGNWSRIPHGCFTYNHWWYKSKWGGWNNGGGSTKCGQNKGWSNRWICVNDKNHGNSGFKSGECQIKKIG